MLARLRRRQAGFTYLGLLAAIVILGLVLTTVSRVWSFSEQRDKEVELLYIGDQFRRGISSYYAFGHRYPAALADLVEDKRFPVPRRHLRQLYRDPFTGAADWMLIMDPTNTAIMGVASKSKLAPIKRRGFAEIEIGFADKDCYCDWKFVYTPPANRYRVQPLPGQEQPPPAQGQ